MRRRSGFTERFSTVSDEVGSVAPFGGSVGLVLYRSGKSKVSKREGGEERKADSNTHVLPPFMTEPSSDERANAPEGD